MKVGVFSDVHDGLDNLKKMLRFFEQEGIDTLIFCGDFCAPFTARVMGAFKGTIHCVFGNGDGDRFTISKFAQTEFQNIKLYGEHAELELDGAKLAITHYPLYGKALARTGDYQAVFSGHTHTMLEERFGLCLHLNPGEILGWKGTPTYAIYDTQKNTVEIFNT